MKKILVVILSLFFLLPSCGEDSDEVAGSDNNSQETADETVTNDSETVEKTDEAEENLDTEPTEVTDNNGTTTDDQTTEETNDETADETQDTTVTEEDPYVCLAATCENVDGNTHTSCGCEADYCVPDFKEVSYAGLVPLTCTKKDCDVNDESSCPENYKCSSMPSFVISMMKQKGVDLPASICIPPKK